MMALNWSSKTRGDTAAPGEALAGIDALLAHPKCAGRRVIYRVDDATLEGGRDAAVAWIGDVAAQGRRRVRYFVDPRSAGPVVVVLSAIEGEGDGDEAR